MNKRDYKKGITSYGTSMCVELFNAGIVTRQADAEKVQQALNIVWDAMMTAKKGANIFFDKKEREFPNRKEYNKAKRAYYKALYAKLYAELETRLNEAVKIFNEGMPKS